MNEQFERLLENWRDGVLTESEIWPNTILEAHARGIPLALVNARMSDRSHRRWLKMKGVAAGRITRVNSVALPAPRLRAARK